MAVVPTRICELVETFDQHIEAYRSQQYNETQVRREFIDPFFEELGWDVSNKSGYAQAYKDVIHEDAIKIGGATKAPDYSFRIGGARKFFLEAKKPSVDIKGDPHPAYQLRRYAWSAKLPLSILTDFEEFAVYDCRIRPKHTDKADVARIMLFTYRDYLKNFSEIADIFSKEAILKGSFDKFAAATKGKRGTSTVDKEFLAEIEKWRNMLARIIALRNAALSVREINFSVQRTIDRILFLRMCEDRGIEPYGQLQSIISGERTYPRLCEVFEKADQKYNSGLFHFHDEPDRSEGPDELTPNIIIDDKDLKWILHSLYYPQSPYEFSVLPAEILGDVYEQFLGKVITLTSGHRANVEDKPEVKKAGGVYYTPSYIVDYIVKNTVGKLCKVKTPRQVSNIKILDPACGSGSFLIGAYQYLLDWHLKYYTENEPEKHMKGKNPKIFETNSIRHSEQAEESQLPHYGLTITEKKRILLNNIYGVDIDSQAVEVTKLSLLLKVLEGESSETIDNQYRLFHERALPDLANNIKCGNSLIGPDFYENLDPESITEELQQKINAFDWQAEFPEIFCRQNPGFDAVIGNPPYVRMESFKELKAHLKRTYFSHEERADFYVYFIEKGQGVLRENGLFGMIVSNKFLRAKYGKPLRSLLAQRAHISHVVDFAGLPVFAGATIRTVVLLSTKSMKKGPILYSPPPLTDRFTSLQGGSLSVEDAIIGTSYRVVGDSLTSSSWSFVNPQIQQILHKFSSKNTTLSEYCSGEICMGVKSGLTEAFVIDLKTRNSIIEANPEAEEIIKSFLNGRDVRRYAIQYKRLYLIYSYHGIDIKRYPSVLQHLRPFRKALEKRATKQAWYELQQPQFAFASFLDGPKIVFPDIATNPRFALDEIGYYGSNTVYFIPRPDLFLLGLLNSCVANLYFSAICAGLEGKTDIYLRFFGQYLEGFPIPRICSSGGLNKNDEDRMNMLVRRILDLHKKLTAAKIPDEKTRIQRQIDTTDKQIDKLVYYLYGLTEEEIKIVENSSE